jgi:hypothetical protein
MRRLPQVERAEPGQLGRGTYYTLDTVVDRGVYVIYQP